MDLFGFDDHSTMDSINIASALKKVPARPKQRYLKRSDKQAHHLSIGQIQQLLMEDSQCDETSNSFTITPDQTIFEDYTTDLESVADCRDTSIVLKPMKPTLDISDKPTPSKTYSKPIRNKKNVLQNIVNYSFDTRPSNDTSIVKPKLKIKKKAKNKNVQDENDEQIEKVAEEINNQFKKIEEYQLLIE